MHLSPGVVLVFALAALSCVVSGQEEDVPSGKRGRDGRNRGNNSNRDTTTKCAPGTRSKTGYEPKCRPCNTGHFNPTGGTAPCKRCPKGHFNPEQGAASCNPCPKNTFSVGSARRKCKGCPFGGITMQEGTSSRHDCIRTDEVGGEPHIMLAMSNGNLCFNLHGKQGDIYNLISDEQHGIYVRGKTFEITNKDDTKLLSYFSHIGVSAGDLAGDLGVIFGTEGFNISGLVFDYNSALPFQNSKFSLSKIGSGPLRIRVDIDEMVSLIVTVHYVTGRSAKYMGVYLLTKDTVSEETGGVIGQFTHTEFDVEDETDEGAYLMFDDNHDAIDTVKVTRHSIAANDDVQCYFYGGVKQGGLIGPQSLYLVKHLLHSEW